MTQRSRGSVLLSRVTETQEQIAETCSVSRVAVSQWKTGQTKPSKPKRAVLFETYGITPTAWDEEPIAGETTMPRSKRRAPKVPTGIALPRPEIQIPEGAIAKAQALESMAFSLLVGLTEDTESPPLERAKVMASIVPTLALLAKLTGQFELGARLFRLPIWKRIEAALAAGLRGHPKAAVACARELRAVEEEYTRAS